MHKTEFLADLREAVRLAANESLAGSGRTADDCPYIEYWFSLYATQDAPQIERRIHIYAPETSNATSAFDYITLVQARVRKSVRNWVARGEITGVPEGMPTDLPIGTSNATPALGARVMFKPRIDSKSALDADPETVRAQLGSGQSLSSPVRDGMESAFRYDFSGVRVHTDPRAAALSRDLGARAFTVGHDVAFAHGEYRPGTPVGDALLAHELAHVVQQRGADGGIQTQGESGQGSSFEDDADRSAIGAVVSLWSGADGGGLARVSQSALPTLRSGLRLQRCKNNNVSPECGTPQRIFAVTNGTFHGRQGLSSYYPDMVGRGYWGSDNTAGPFDTGTRVGASVQLIGIIPSTCDPSTFRLGQTVTYVRTVRNGTHHPDEGKTMDDIAKSGRDASQAPFRQEFPEAGNIAISMADPPSVAYQPGDDIEWDRSFVTSLRGPSGAVSVDWSTSIRVVNGTVTQNTIA